MLNTPDTVSELIPNQEFAKLASDEQIERAAEALEANGFHTVIAGTGKEAKRIFFELIPEGAEVFLGASVTLEKLGIKDEIDKSGRFDALRPKMFALNRETQGREIRRLGGTPDDAAGSQLGPYASGAGKVIWIVGEQKIVKDFNEGLRRIREYCYPLEEEHMQQLYKTGTGINKVLIVNHEIRSNRITMIIVKEELGLWKAYIMPCSLFFVDSKF